MSTAVQPVEATKATCKCCGAMAYSYGFVDFHKNCESRRRKVLDPSGVLIRYHRCPSCHFVFTTDFDGFTHDDFRRHIYNDDYILVDPDYREERPRAQCGNPVQPVPRLAARAIARLRRGRGLAGRAAPRLRGSPTWRPTTRSFLGSPPGPPGGLIASPASRSSSTPPTRHRVFAELNELLTDPGLVLFSTLLQPADMAFQGLSWWYASPRNGHVSLYTDASLRALAQPFGLDLASFNESTHVLLRGRPGFASHFLN